MTLRTRACGKWTPASKERTLKCANVSAVNSLHRFALSRAHHHPSQHRRSTPSSMLPAPFLCRGIRAPSLSRRITIRAVGGDSAALAPRALNGSAPEASAVCAQRKRAVTLRLRLPCLGQRGEDRVQGCREGVEKRTVYPVQVTVCSCKYCQVHKPQAHLALLAHL
jgi:hypothetical protein